MSLYLPSVPLRWARVLLDIWPILPVTMGVGNMNSVRKSAQIAAFFLAQSGKSLDRLKLIKLMYFADRQAMATFGHPISDDLPYAMQHGMVLSETLDLIRGVKSSSEWSAWVRPSFHIWLKSARPVIALEDLDELSPADLEVLKSVWTTYGGLTGKALEHESHQLHEWRNPGASSVRVKEAEVFRALGKSDDESATLQREIEAHRALAKKMAEFC